MLLMGTFGKDRVQIIFDKNMIDSETIVYDCNGVISAYKKTLMQKLEYNSEKAKSIYEELVSVEELVKKAKANIKIQKGKLCKNYEYKKYTTKYTFTILDNTLIYYKKENTKMPHYDIELKESKVQQNFDILYQSNNVKLVKEETKINENDYAKFEKLSEKFNFAKYDNNKFSMVESDEDVIKYINALKKYNGEIGIYFASSKEQFTILDNINNLPKTPMLEGIVLTCKKEKVFYFPCNHTQTSEILVRNEMQEYSTIIENELDKLNISKTERTKWTSDVVLMQLLKPILETKNIVTINAQEQWKIAKCYNVNCNYIRDVYVDYMIMNNLQTNKTFTEMCYLFNNTIIVERKDVLNGAKDFTNLSTNTLRYYYGIMGYNMWEMFDKLKKNFPDNLQKVRDIEFKTILSLSYIEYCGIHFVKNELVKQEQTYKNKEIDLEFELRQLCNLNSEVEKELYEERKNYTNSKNKNDLKELKSFNEKLKSCFTSGKTISVSSTQQIKKYLFDTLKIKNFGDKTLSRDNINAILETLDENSLDSKILKLYREWKDINTLNTKFFETLPLKLKDNQFVFSSFSTFATQTGRMSSSNPNIQQFPSEITSLIVPRDNFTFLDIDYSQIECRVVVGLANEENMISKFNSPNIDYHTLMASEMFNVPYEDVTHDLRKQSKGLTFGLLYGMGDYSTAKRIFGDANSNTLKKTKEIRDKYFARQPKVKEYFNKIDKEASENYYVETISGRRRYWNKDINKALLHRQSINTVVQGSAADIFKMALNNVFDYIKSNDLFDKVLISNVVHDEILIEISNELDKEKIIHSIIKCMNIKLENFPILMVGAGVTDTSWQDAKEKEEYQLDSTKILDIINKD